MIIIYVGFHKPFVCLAYIHDVTNFELSGFLSIEHDEWIGTLFRLLALIFYCFSLHGALIVIISRAWLIYYSIRWSQQRLKYQHNLYSDDNLSQSNENTNYSKFWFIAHRKILGAHRAIYKYNILYYLIEAIGLLSIFIYNQRLGALIDAILYFIEMMVLVIIWNKIPKFVDILAIKKEIRAAGRISFCSLLLYVLWMVIVSVYGYHLYAFMIFQTFTGIMSAMTAITMNSYIFQSKYSKLLTNVEAIQSLHKHIDNGNLMSTSDRNKDLGEENNNVNVKSDIELQLSTVVCISDKHVKTMTLSDTLKNENMVSEFFKHLSDEFSTELLLSFVEFTEYKEVLKADNEFMENIKEQIQIHINDNIEELANISLDEDIILTKSEIISKYTSNQSTDDVEIDMVGKYLCMVKDLWYKYIRDGAEFEININSDSRSTINRFVKEYGDDGSMKLDKQALYQMYNLFEECRKHIYGLMLLSHDRFIETRNDDNISIPTPTADAVS